MLFNCKELEEAVEIAFKIAKKVKAKSIILSPASSSFDKYKNFEERGNYFKEIAFQKLAKLND